MILNVYQGTDLVGTGEGKVHVDLPAKEYPAGTFAGELVDGTGAKSDCFNFPAVTVAAGFDPNGDVKPTDSNTVAEITAWLDAHTIDHTGKSVKADLLALVPVD
ncbi:hypothetical protein [Levilactobacillus brevis]|uniref:hypothetical protein n=1 Tax=Levilactobacillus brevis TaxID=1580 RepID=UPI0035A2E14D